MGFYRVLLIMAPRRNVPVLQVLVSVLVLFKAIQSGVVFQQNDLSSPLDDVVGEKLDALSFNVQIFGQSKISKPDVVQILIEIFDRSDVSMMMEIRDSAQTAFPEFVSQLNAYSGHTYNWTVGDRKGRSSSKEQYGWIWRVDKVELEGFLEYNDTDDNMERPPSVAQFKTLESGRKFVWVASHTQPSNTLAEMNALVDVYDVSTDYFGTDNAIKSGDLNAACSYCGSSCWADNQLLIDQRFFWIVSTYANTTVAKSSCAYDRVVLAGKQMTQQVRNAHVFRYDLAWDVEYQLVKDVSDHYPIEFEIFI